MNGRTNQGNNLKTNFSIDMKTALTLLISLWAVTSSMGQRNAITPTLSINMTTLKFKGTFYITKLEITAISGTRPEERQTVTYATEPQANGRPVFRMNGQIPANIIGKETTLNYTLPYRRIDTDSYIRKMNSAIADLQRPSFNHVRSLSSILENVGGATPVDIVCNFISRNTR